MPSCPAKAMPVMVSFLTVVAFFLEDLLHLIEHSIAYVWDRALGSTRYDTFHSSSIIGDKMSTGLKT